MGALILGVLQPVLWILVLALILSGDSGLPAVPADCKPINSLDLENPRLDETYEELFPWSAACGSRTAPLAGRWTPWAAGAGGLPPYREHERRGFAHRQPLPCALRQSERLSLAGEKQQPRHPAGDLPAGDLGGRGQKPWLAAMPRP